MAETPVDPGSSPEPTSLGFSLGFIEGSALVSLTDRRLAEGLVVRALDLQLAEVEFPLNLEGGAESFQRRSTALRSLVLDVHVELIGRALTEALEDGPLESVHVRTEGDRLTVEVGLADATFVGTVLLSHDADRTVRLHLLDPIVVGPSKIDAWSIPPLLLDAARRALGAESERIAESLRLAGATTFAIDPADALLWGLLPPHGWKVPHHDEAPVHRVSITPTGFVRVALGAPSKHADTDAGTAADEQDVLRALARDDIEKSLGLAREKLDRGDAVGAFTEMRNRLDASGGPDALVARLLALGATVERLFDETNDLADDRLEKDPADVRALLAKGAIASAEVRADEAADAFERAGRKLKAEAHRRAAGLAFRAAAAAVARLRKKGSAKRRVRLLEDTIALRPDDTVALSALVSALPAQGRAPAAVRAARRLANLANDIDTRVLAHVSAGELLRDPIGDLPQAQREFERALRIREDDPAALEGLARAVMDAGEPRRAAVIFEQLIERAEADGQRDRAARMSLALGDLWRPLDAEAAMLRFQRARELDRTSVPALARIAEVAIEHGGNEAAMEAVESALPMLDEGRIGGDRAAALSLRLTAGRLYEEHADLIEEAIVQYDAALALAPNTTEALVALSRLYERQGNTQHRAEVIDRHAKLLVGAGDLEGAAKAWVEEARIHKDDPKRVERIRSAIVEGLAKERSHRGLLDALVEIASLGDDASAQIDAIDRRLLLDDPPQVRAPLLTRLGAAFESAAREVEAARAYEEAVACDERSKEAIHALSRIYRSRDDHERLAGVLALAGHLAVSDEERGELLTERARLLRTLGRDDEAYASIQDALKAAPESSAALAVATKLAIKLNDHEAAKRHALHRLAQSESLTADKKLPIYVDLARVAEATERRDELIDALEHARDLADPESETGRQIAARLARELYGAERLEELAELQRRRGRVATAAATERAERFIEAARLSARLAQHEQLVEDVEEALSILGRKRQEVELKLKALDVLESHARQREDLALLADVLGRRASFVGQAEEKERLWLEQADVFDRIERYDDAVKALQGASDALPSSFKLAERYGRAAQRAMKSGEAAEAFGRAAQIARARGEVELGLEMHGRAAETYALMRDREAAAEHDRALLELSGPSTRSPYLAGAMERLERFGRDHDDPELLADILGRRANEARPEDAARMLLEKSEVHLAGEGGERDGVDALRRARNLAPPGTQVAEAIDDRLVEILEQLGLHAEQAAVLVERADRAPEGASKAELYFRAAELYAERLRDRGMALSRAQAAVRADPSHDEARALRIQLLRAGGRRDALAEALAEEAELCRDARRAAELWLEAAQIITPVDNHHALDPREVEQSLQLVRRAATASPSSVAAFEAGAVYTRTLERADEEVVLLGHVVERATEASKRIAARIRRVDLFAGPLRQPADAQTELMLILPELVGLQSAECAAIEAELPAESARRLEVAEHGGVRMALLQLGLTLTELQQDWTAHVQVLMWLVDVSADAEVRAELRTRAGGVLEWKLGDGEGAEREYLAALALLPGNDRPKQALENFYMAVDRFADIADNLGTETLVEVWGRLGDDEPPNRLIAAAEALWPKLPEGSDERAEVQLRLADLYVQRDRESESADAVHILEQVEQRAPRQFQDAALERLRVFFLEKERADLYCDVLRRQAERLEDDHKRALALAELGEALEWKLGDGLAAENEYRAALAADAECVEAKRRLAQLLSSQDRFEEIGRELGVETLEGVLVELLGQGSRDRERAIAAADALAPILPPERVGGVWLRVADSFEVDEPTDASAKAVRVALQRASEADGPNQKQALTRLTAWLAQANDRGELANVLRRRVEMEKDPELRASLQLELGRLVMSMLSESEGPGREAIEEEAERELRSALETDARNEEARALLERLYLERARYLEIGRVLGREVLERLRVEGETSGDVAQARGAVAALAEMSEGSERAGLLVELVGYAEDAEGQPGWPRTPEDLYRAALVADSGHGPAREGLRALLESEGRYREIADALDVAALVDTLEGLRRSDDDRHQVLPASLALANALENTGAPRSAQATLWTEIASLHIEDEDSEAAERALREALALQSDHEDARELMRELFVAERRLEELAEIDEALVATTAQRASETGDAALQIDALDVLASRKSGERRADTLVWIAALERERGFADRAEARLIAAIEAHAPHAVARAELEGHLWRERRFADVVERLGATALLARVTREVDDDPDGVVAAANATRDLLEPADRARLDELIAPVQGLEALERAKAIWDELGDAAGRFRVRQAIVDLRRKEGDAAQLLLALEGAHAYATNAEDRARIAVERAGIMTAANDRDRARALVEPLVDDLTLPRKERQDAARLLVEDLLPEVAAAPSEDVLELRARSLEVLTELPSAGPPPGDVEKWFVQLSKTREALDYDAGSVAQPLESALRVRSQEDDGMEIRRRLVELYEEVGDWAQAEPHASVIAEADDRPEQWVQLSELRAWLDDPQGAQSALDRALELDPASESAHESMIRLAEQTGEATSVITRLEAWAEVDAKGEASDRAKRLLRAAELAIEAGDAERGALLAERAVTLVPRKDPSVEAIALEACAILAPSGLADARIAILTRVVQEAGADVSSSSRIALADLLVEQDRIDEARTVVEQGVHREAAEDDPLLDRLVEMTRSLTPDAGARRMLATAERLGAGPAARRLRMAGAELAESAGERETARAALTNIVSELGGEATKAREALVRITRDLDDAPALVAALEEAALDASTSVERAEKWAEAAAAADERLDDPERAELLLSRAIASQPNDVALRQRRIDLLQRRGRWFDLLEAYASEAERAEGPAKIEWLERRAALASERLGDEATLAASLEHAFDLGGDVQHAIRAMQAYRNTYEFDALLSLAERVPVKAPEVRTVVDLLIADAMESLGRIEEARAMLERLAAEQFDVPLVQHRWCTFLHRHRDLELLARALETIAINVEPREGVRWQLAAVRVLLKQVDDRVAAEAGLAKALEIVGQWLDSPGAISGDLLPGPTASRGLTERAMLDAPLLDLSHLADRLGNGKLRVDALRLYAQSLVEGPEQWRALLLLAAAERDTGDLEAAEFTLRGVVDAVRESAEVSFVDRVEAERSLGALLLDRGHVEEAIVALEHASKMLADAQPIEDEKDEAAHERAQVLVLLASAYRTADRAQEAVDKMIAARALDPAAVPEPLLDDAIQAAGPSEELARQLQRRADGMSVPRERAAALYEAAQTWESIGRPERAFEPWIAAHEADPSNSKIAVRLQSALYESERHVDLERHLARRIAGEDLTGAENASLRLARAKILDRRLGLTDEALRELEHAAQLVPQSFEVLTALADLADRIGRDDVAGDAYARLATVATTEIAKRRALAKRASILERAGRSQGALQCLEEAVDGALAVSVVPRALVERLAVGYAARGAHAEAARVWVRASSVLQGAEAAACLFRAGEIRRAELDDRRGAMAALDAAARKAPDDLGLRRAVIHLAKTVGDGGKVERHTREALERARRLGAMDAARTFEASQRMNGDAEGDEAYRQERARLDRSGRVADLAQFVALEAEKVDDDELRAERFAQVGRLYAGSKLTDRGVRAAQAYARALDANPDHVEALAFLARAAAETEDWEHAETHVSRLEALGGPDWPAPEFELFAAHVASARGDTQRAFGRLLQAASRDPGSLRARRELIYYAHRTDDADVATRLVDDYEGLLDPVLDVDALAAVHAERSLVSLTHGDSARALREVERILEVAPQDERAHRIRRKILEQSGETHDLLDALEDEASRSTDDDEARTFWLRALDVADGSGDVRRARRIVAALEPLAVDEALWRRLFAHHRQQLDGAGMLRAMDRLGPDVADDLDVEARATLVKACFEAGRVDEGARILVGTTNDALIATAGRAFIGDEGAAIPRVVTQTLAALKDRAGGLLVVERLHEVVPNDRRVLERLAGAYAADPARHADAARVLRCLLAEEPADLEHLRRLIEVAPDDAHGARAALAWIEDGEILLHGWTQPGEDGSLSGIADDLGVAIHIVEGGGIEVTFGAEGLAVGEALAVDAGPTELRFLAVRAQALYEGATVAAANQSGLSATGDLAGAIRALRRLEPRTWSERVESARDRLACSRRWRPISDLIAFAVSTAYIPPPAPKFARF